MSKIIKEIIILLLVCLVGMLLFSVVFYEYIPNRKIIPEVTQYSASEKIKEQKADDIDKRDEQIVKTFEVTSSDLNNFKVTKDYVAGKANPFASVANDVEASASASKSSDGSSSSSSSKSGLQSYAHDLCINTYGWSENDYQCLVKLWNRESGWNPNAHNKSSGAYGIAQALPASKMSSEGSDYYTNGKTQIRWGLKYIKNRYGTPASAWAHSESHHWY